MDIKQIKDTNLILQIIGIDEARKILTNWVYNDKAEIASLDTAEFGLIAAYTKWTLITEANHKSINDFLGYILMKCKIHKDKKYRKKKVENVLPIKKFSELE